jgi:hypothetical protein
MTLTENSRCGIHGLSTTSGRCAACDIDSEQTPHPAKWSEPVLEVIAGVVAREADPDDTRAVDVLHVLDPFAGVDCWRLAQALHPHAVVGVELEPEWARQSPQTQVGNALELAPDWFGAFDVVATSPTYGNRMADHHTPREDSERHTYRHTLGREPSSGSSAVLQWGPNYRAFHELALREMIRVLVVDGLLVINMSNHIRDGEEQLVVEWWVNAILLAGCRLVEVQRVRTRRQRHGENGGARVDGEVVIVARTPSTRRLL